LRREQARVFGQKEDATGEGHRRGGDGHLVLIVYHPGWPEAAQAPRDWPLALASEQPVHDMRPERIALREQPVLERLAR
jgi:hypothetical protein